jgi:hypothetical protein
MATTVITVPETSVNAGTYPYTAAFTAGQYTSVALATQMPANEITDATLSLSLTLEWSSDGGATYAPGASCGWQGGPQDTGRWGNPPGLVASVPAGADSVRATLTVAKKMTLGATVTLSS